MTDEMLEHDEPDQHLVRRRAELQNNLDRFRELSMAARRQCDRDELVDAAAKAQVASTWASLHHTGLWASPELERLLLAIGRRAIQPGTGVRLSSRSEIRRVLHVLTQVGAVGGHSRMVWRWMSQDRTRQHSVVITRQGSRPIPTELIEATRASGGDVSSLSRRRGDILTCARQLRDLACDHDVVVLHVYPEDVLPLVAFADPAGLPPVAFIDQADHAFTLGAGAADLYVGLRSTGIDLAVERRNVQRHRTVLLPITLPPIERTVDRSEAKRLLDLPEDAVVLASIARGSKFRPFEGQHFTATFKPLLERHPNVMLVVVGPNPDDDWRLAETETHGRIRVFGERSDVALYYQAADIYVDSFPVNSNTSLLEAGGYSVPLVSRCRYPGRHSIMCADSPGLSDHVRRSADVDEYVAEIERLIIDGDERRALGTRTRDAVIRAHVGDGWQESLEQVYAAAIALPPHDRVVDSLDMPLVEDIDLRWDEMVGSGPPVAEIQSWFVKGLPLRHRLRWWTRIVIAQRRLRLRLLVPEWVTAAFRTGLSGVRRFIS